VASPLLTIAQFACGVRAEDVPESTRRHCGALIADSVACTVGALATPEGRAFARALQGIGTYRVYDTGEAFAGAHTDAYLANLLDFDDVYEGSGHVGCVIVPAALPVAAMAGARGDDTAAALIPGLEVGCRLAEASRPSEDARQQIWGIGSRMAPAAAAAAARALGLSTDATAHAIALACATAPLASVRKTVYGGSGVTWVKNNMGIAAAGAVSAALLAREGARGPLDVWDGEQGFGRMIGTDRWAPGAAAADLGSTWYVDRRGFKAYPCCRHAHAVVDAALAARAELGVSADAIERVAVAGSAVVRADDLHARAGARACGTGRGRTAAVTAGACDDLGARGDPPPQRSTLPEGRRGRPCRSPSCERNSRLSSSRSPPAPVPGACTTSWYASIARPRRGNGWPTCQASTSGTACRPRRRARPAPRGQQEWGGRGANPLFKPRHAPASRPGTTYQ
jgi:hypothetical protein